jgi:hypothetical protein
MFARSSRFVGVAILAGLIAVGAAQAADLMTFARMIRVAGIASELNPVVGSGLVHFGVPVLIAAKVALVVLVLAIATILARRHLGLAATVLTLATFAGLVGALSNVLALAIALA